MAALDAVVHVESRCVDWSGVDLDLVADGLVVYGYVMQKKNMDYEARVTRNGVSANHLLNFSMPERERHVHHHQKKKRARRLARRASICTPSTSAMKGLCQYLYLKIAVTVCV